MNKISEQSVSETMTPIRKTDTNKRPYIFNWIKIDIYLGAKYHSDFLKLKLSATFKGDRSLCRFFGFRVIDTKVSFFVDNQQFANHVLSLSNQIKIPNSRKKLTIKKCWGLPQILLTDCLQECIKLSIIERFDNKQNVLNLDRFHYDPIFEDKICCLYVSNVIEFVFKQITEQIPNVCTIILSNNRLRNFNYIAKYTDKLKSLSTLDVSNNCIENVNILKPFCNSPIVKLNIVNNPIMKKLIQNNTKITQNLMKLFSKLENLNDNELTTTFNLEMLNLKVEEESLTENQHEENSVFFTSEETHSKALLFLQQYIEYYEQNPEHVLNAYTPDCTFELQFNLDSQYLVHNAFSTIQKLLQFPKIKYDRDTIVSNLIENSPQMVQVVVDGIIEECETQIRRSFSKLLNLVPYKGGLQIQNEIFRISAESSNVHVN